MIIFFVAVLVCQSGVCDNSKQNATQSNEGDNYAGHRIADLNLTRLRTSNERQLRDLIIMFPKEIGGSFECYQISISNYVEDKWGSGGMNFLRYVLPIQKYLGVDSAITRPFESEPGVESQSDLAGNATRAAQEAGISYAEMLARIDDLNLYLTSCTSMKPVEWSVVGRPLPESNLVVIGQKLGFFHLLLQEIFASRLPYDDKGYVGCIARLFFEQTDSGDPCHQDKRCIETIPNDARDFLFDRLAELKAHGCTGSYALEMKRH